MALFDAHCHLDQLADPDQAVERALAAGVTRILSVSEGLESGRKVLELKKRHPGTVAAGLGIHPMYSVRLSGEEIEEGIAFIERHLEEADALGEVGLDFKHARTEEQRTFQRRLLDRLLVLARSVKKPVNLHSRWSERAVMEVAIRYRRAGGAQALLHWFTSSVKLVRICAEEGVFISVGPSILSSEQTQKVCRHLPEELLLLETDSPVPFDGEPAEPAWVARVFEKLAEVRGADSEKLEAQVNENFQRYLGT